MKIHNVEQRSPEWFQLRAGLPTASSADKLITSTGKESKQVTDYAYQLAGEMYAGKPLDRWEGNSATERGSNMENEALIAYEQFCGAWADRIGFCTNDDVSYGCSPDGFVRNGLVEIKCLGAKNHVKNMVYFDKHEKAMPDYIPQTQMQMLVCEKEWCDLVFYHPDLPMLIIRQEKDLAIQAMLVKQLAVCIEMRDSALKVIQYYD